MSARELNAADQLLCRLRKHDRRRPFVEGRGSVEAVGHDILGAREDGVRPDDRNQRIDDGSGQRPHGSLYSIIRGRR
jgi:hypothetical protein